MFRRRRHIAGRARTARRSDRTFLPSIESLENRRLLAGVNAPDVLASGETAHFDFGPASSVVAAQMTGVTPSDLFTHATDHGFVAATSINLKAIERAGVWGDHSRDFAQGRVIVFAMRVDPDLPHNLAFAFGDPFRRREIELSIEGTVVDTFNIPKGQLEHPSYMVDAASDGVLEIKVRATGDKAALMNHLIVTAATAPANDPGNDPGNDLGTNPTGGSSGLPTSHRLDFGTSTSSVHSQMTRVTHTDRFDANSEYGLDVQNSANLTSRSRNGSWGDHSRDFIKGNVITVAMRLDPSQSYNLSFGFGDALGKSRSQSVSLEGVVVDQLSIPARRLVSSDYDTTVSGDGILEITIRSTSSRPALVNFVSAVPISGGNTGGGSNGGGVPNQGTNTSYRLDFGTATSAVKDAMLRVTDANRFNANTDYGFVTQSSVNLASRSRNGSWGEHSRDFVKGDVITLSLRLDPSLTYNVSMGFGDATGNSRAQSISIEGTIVDQLAVPARTLVVSDYATAISTDGILDITIRSTISRSALVNYLVVLPGSPPQSSSDGCSSGADHTTSSSDPSPAWLDLFPPSTAPTFDDDSQPITCGQQYQPGTNWSGLDERQVFANRLTVTDSSQQPTYEYRIGKGSQLYSLRVRDDAGRWREAVGSQRAGTAEWIDEVIQSVLVDTQLNDRSSESTKNQIHQSGTYRNLAAPTFYSPVLADSWQPDERSFSTINWPQQAHIPSEFKSHFLQMQQIRDLGSGVLEVTYVYHNFSQEGEKVDFLAAPWLPVRDSAYPFQFRSLPDGTIQRDQRDWCVESGCGPQVEPIDAMGGYFLFSSGTETDDDAFALVFGDDSDNDGQRSGSRFRWGTVTTGGRDLTAASLQKLVTIDPGEIFYTRVFLITNGLRDTRIMARQLSGHVSQGYLDTELTSTVDACLVFENGDVAADVCSATNTIATVSTTPRPGWQPLIELREAATGNHTVTNDPYELMRRPYLKEYEAEGILGWASPSTLADLALISDPDIADHLMIV